MKLFIHKLDCIIDPYANNLVSQEPVLLAKALVSFAASPFDTVVLISNQSKALQTINGKTIQAVTVKDVLSNAISITADDVWILWGGWVDLLNMLSKPVAESVIALHNKWRFSEAARMTLCTDMRFPFKRVNFVNAGRIELHGAFDEPVLELSQCMHLTADNSIFESVQWIPLFMLPVYSNVHIEHRHIGSKTLDLIYATRDWHMLSESRLQKIIRYYIDSNARSSFLGEHKYTNALISKLTDEQKQLLNDNCTFDYSVPFYSVPYAMSYAAAHVAIGDKQYDKFGLIPNRVGEAVVANILTFIDNSVDPQHVIFGQNATLEQFSYVKTADDVRKRLAAFNKQPDMYAHMCSLQNNYLKQTYDVAKYFFAATYEHINKHKHTHNCNICPCKL